MCRELVRSVGITLGTLPLGCVFWRYRFVLSELVTVTTVDCVKSKVTKLCKVVIFQTGTVGYLCLGGREGPQCRLWVSHGRDTIGRNLPPTGPASSSEPLSMYTNNTTNSSTTSAPSHTLRRDVRGKSVTDRTSTCGYRPCGLRRVRRC